MIFCQACKRTVSELVEGEVCRECYYTYEQSFSMVKNLGDVIVSDLTWNGVEPSPVVVLEREKEIKPIYPKDIYAKLEESIIGQEHTKRVLSIAAANHHKKVSGGLSAIKSNILLLGPTGCGKTLFAQVLGEILDVPVSISDATALTQAGYVGGDIEDVVTNLVRECNYDLEKAESGIIFIDEIDKIRADRSTNRDVGGEGVQQALLKLIEGRIIDVPTSGSKNASTVEVDTSNILFICAGSFAGIEKTIERRVKTKASIGFGSNIDKSKTHVDDLYSKVNSEDLEKFGIIPELLGRLPIVSALRTLKLEDLVNIATEVKGSVVEQFKEVLAVDNKKLVIHKKAIEVIAKQSIKNKLGARGLRATLEKVLESKMFDITDQEEEKITITAAYAKQQLKE
jgi:ATP-dependent Clp protease ATP-binding subunit ClpX